VAVRGEEGRGEGDGVAGGVLGDRVVFVRLVQLWVLLQRSLDVVESQERVSENWLSEAKFMTVMLRPVSQSLT